MDRVRHYIREVPDFPREGVVFKDFGPVMADPECNAAIRRELYEQVKDLGITKVAVLETRGYVFGCTLAQDLRAGIVPVRKAGKLPGECITCAYDSEYRRGERFQVQAGLLGPADVVLVHDDLLATGGSLRAAIAICALAGVEPRNVYVSVVAQIPALGGAARLAGCRRVFCLLDV